MWKMTFDARHHGMYKVVIVDDRGSVYVEDDFRRPSSWDDCKLRAARQQLYVPPSLTAKCVRV
jgi:hypothetical protein